MPPLLLLKDITLTLGTTALLDGAELSLGEGERLALVGRNGSGKSTLLKIAAGLVEADGGARFAQPGATIRYLPQEPSLTGFATTLDYVQAGLAPGDDQTRAYYLLGNLGLSGLETPATLSGGEARRAALARVLAPRPDILLLDEPTNHLDVTAIEWLEGELKAMRTALVLISHDRRFLENLSRAVVWLDRGQTRRLEQGFGAFENWRDMLLDQEETERHKRDRKIVQELDWVRHGVSGRRKRNQGRLGRLDQLRQGRREELKQLGSVKMEAAEAETSGTKVIDAKGISKSFGDKTVIANFSIRIHRGDRIGIVGPNGVGKTTLLKMLTGELAPDTGNVKLGMALAMAKLDQNRAALNPEDTLANVLTGGGGDTVFVGGKPRNVISYMQDFLFTASQARTPVKVLSGGERARLLLARLFAAPSNFLVLDEPTNDLDLETLDLLEEVLADYPGTVLVVSHDRDFLDRVVTQTVAPDGGGHFTVYAGGYSDMLNQRRKPSLTLSPSKGEEARSAERGKGTQPASAASRNKKSLTLSLSKGEGPKGKPSTLTLSLSKGEGPKGKRHPEPVEGSQQAPKRPPKMNFSDLHLLKTLPGKIEALNTTIAALEAQLHDPGLYSRDPAKFARLSADLAAAQATKSADEETWLTLELKREEMEG